MRPTLVYAVHDEDNRLRARVAHAEDAACLVSFLGRNATVRNPDGILWREGRGYDGEAGESYDEAAHRIMGRAERFARLNKPPGAISEGKR